MGNQLIRPAASLVRIPPSPLVPCAALGHSLAICSALPFLIDHINICPELGDPQDGGTMCRYFRPNRNRGGYDKKPCGSVFNGRSKIRPTVPVAIALSPPIDGST
eukprot:3088454-Rhodomonas_salina.4